MRRRDLPIKRGGLWAPWTLDIGGIFGELLSHFPFTGLSREVVPPIDLYEEKDKIVVRAELPQVDPKEVQISIDQGTLTIRGEKKYERKVEEKGLFRQEAAYGSFHRVVGLPAEVKADQAKATYKNGVLKIEIPKSGETKGKRIDIEIE